MKEEVELVGIEKGEEVSVKEVISIDYLPKNKSPINNLFLVAPLFTPCSRNLKMEDRYREIVIKDQFGYSIEIRGPRLNMTVDFPIWSHIMKLVIEQKSNKIVMGYTDFAKIMGYDRKSLGNKLKERIKESLIRMRSQVIITEEIDDEDDDEIMGLLDNGKIKKVSKEVVLIVNKRIIDLYKQDRFKLIDLDYYNSLNNEITKALFLYYENHRDVVYPIKLSNIKERLNLVSKNDKEINRQIKAGHNNLMEKEYLSNYEYSRINKERYVKVYK